MPTVPKTKPTILKAVRKYTAKPETKIKIKQYYKDNKEVFKQRSRSQYLKTKEILDKYKAGLLIPIKETTLINNSSVIDSVENNI